MSDFRVMTMDEIEAEAEKLKCRVVVATPKELQFDLDNESAWECFQKFYKLHLLKRWKNLGPFQIWLSKSGNRHAVVELPEEFPVEARIAIQVMGGSDVKREWAALNCHQAGSPHPILLYRPIEVKA